MAKQVITVLTDDLDGSEAERTVEFGLDGVTYTIDLSGHNIGRLRRAFDPYVAVAARGRGGVKRHRSTATTSRVAREHAHAIREWAAKNGWELSRRGRIPRAVVEAYQHR